MVIWNPDSDIVSRAHTPHYILIPGRWLLHRTQTPDYYILCALAERPVAVRFIRRDCSGCAHFVCVCVCLCACLPYTDTTIHTQLQDILTIFSTHFWIFLFNVRIEGGTKTHLPATLNIFSLLRNRCCTWHGNIHDKKRPFLVFHQYPPTYPGGTAQRGHIVLCFI